MLGNRRTLRRLSTLHHAPEHAPTPSARLWLTAAALLLLPLDIVLLNCVDPDYRFGTLAKDGARLAAAWGTVIVLLAGGRIRRQDIGLSVGRPVDTAYWTLYPAALTVVVYAALFAPALIFGVSEQKLAALRPSDMHSIDGATDFFWRGVVMAPLIEELLHRGLLVSALAACAGRRTAIWGGAAAFAVLHLLYGRPPVTAVSYFFVGALLSWVFLNSRSLAAPMLLHAAGNLCVLVKDVLLLERPDLIRRWFGGGTTY